MNLLLDQNISRRLVAALEQHFAVVRHVSVEGLDRATDSAIWDFAKAEGLVIVSKDSDFHQRSFVFGHPPKVIWIRLGNCTTSEIGEAIIQHVESIETFVSDDRASFLVLP